MWKFSHTLAIWKNAYLQFTPEYLQYSPGIIDEAIFTYTGFLKQCIFTMYTWTFIIFTWYNWWENFPTWWFFEAKHIYNYKTYIFTICTKQNVHLPGLQACYCIILPRGCSRLLYIAFFYKVFYDNIYFIADWWYICINILCW